MECRRSIQRSVCTDFLPREPVPGGSFLSGEPLAAVGQPRLYSVFPSVWKSCVDGAGGESPFARLT